MDILNVLLTCAIVGGVGFTIYAANVEQVSPGQGSYYRRLLWLLLLAQAILAFFVLQSAVFASLSEIDPSGSAVPLPAALVFALVSGFVTAFCAAVLRSPRFGGVLKRMLPYPMQFNPTLPVHQTAIVVLLSLLAYSVGTLALSGGIQGLADELTQAGGVSVAETLLNQVLWIVAALLGTGLFLRRTPTEAAVRLGLRFPTARDVFTGLGSALLMLVIIYAIALIWTALVSPEQLAEQTAASQAIAGTFDTLSEAFIISVAVAVGEEILFRGALQPVFGIALSSLYFVVLHTQYSLTPASLGILMVSFVLAFLRKRESTTAAIIAHFAYNFAQLTLAILAASLLGR